MPDDGYRSMQIGPDTAETKKAAVVGELGPRSVSDEASQRLGCSDVLCQAMRQRGSIANTGVLAFRPGMNVQGWGRDVETSVIDL